MVDFIEFAMSRWLAYKRKKIGAEEDTLVEIQMAERGTHGNIVLIRTTKRQSRTIEELAARAANEWRKGGALELALYGPSPVVWHIGCLFFLLLALVSRITSGKKVSRCHQGTVYTHPGGEVNVTESEAFEPGAGNKHEAAANWPAEREQSEGIEVSETARTNSTTTMKAKKSSNKDEYNRLRIGAQKARDEEIAFQREIIQEFPTTKRPQESRKEFVVNEVLLHVLDHLRHSNFCPTNSMSQSVKDIAERIVTNLHSSSL